ncbi:hypothetical protein [Jiella sonneratiae]|uniref:Membrane-anchored protein n=1 Tax=Jiella sonneratiae TaxID=2816856 RepID=A0ABS3J4U9_9HYPH|nr:hypothetical protein [Jiella sonneratiae]MBO0904150.1 hypothetical protein [Jiella sonneratiae]
MTEVAAVDEQTDDGHFARLVGLQRRWLARRGLSGRPWLILGAAPGPTIPSPLPAGIAHVHVKYSGHSARRNGLPPADLTLLLHKTTARDVAGLTIRNVLRMRRRPSRLARLGRRVGIAGFREAVITHAERDLLIERTLGSLFASGGRDVRPSNGVAMICYAIAMGIPTIVVAGISLEADGYDYDPTIRNRRHQAEDRAALRRIAAVAPQVVTSEPALAEMTGIPLWKPVAERQP